LATYGIVYSTVSKAIRRVIADDDGLVIVGTLPDGKTPAVVCQHIGKPSTYFRIMPGESALSHVPPSLAAAATPAHWAAVVEQATGVKPPNLTCALVDGRNIVTGLISADINVDSSPDSRLMVDCYSPVIALGCTFDTNTQLFSTPGGTLPPHSPGNSTDNPIDIPPAVIPRP
jgi:hypothetical protein